MKIVVAVVASLIVCGAARVANAGGGDQITIGLYAPTAPFAGTGDRVSFVNAIADHLSASAGGRKVTGKVYSSAGAFSAAVKKGEIQFAVIDAPYGAAIGLPYKILGSATRGGSATGPWLLVAGAGVTKLADLKGKRLAVPAIGAKDQAFVSNALLDGEVDASFFAAIVDAADARSALTLVSVGKADAALVPSGVDLPGGLTSIVTLRAVGWPMFVALPGAPDDVVTSFGGAITGFSGTGTFTGFAAGDAGHAHALAGSFGREVKRGPMAVPPPARLTVREILEGRGFGLPASNVLDLVEAPHAR